MERNRTLDVIKGLCILLVIFTHSAWQDNQRLTFLFPFWVNMAVPVFMVISGYVSSLSMKHRKVESIGSAYQLTQLVPKLIRYTVPFLLAFIIEEVAFLIGDFLGVHTATISIKSVVSTFLAGGSGPGSYYYPIMFQFVFVFPIIFFIIRKHDYRGVIICLIVNGVYELLKWAYGMNEECYRLLLFRYFF